MPAKRSQAEVDRLIAMWRAGAAGREIADRLDWPSGTVATWVRRLQRRGVLCHRGGRAPLPSAAIPARLLRAAVAAMPAADREAGEARLANQRDGLTFAEIGDRYSPGEARLANRYREVYLARRDGMTFAEIGDRYSRTREWARLAEFAALVEIAGGEAAVKRIADDAAATVADATIIGVARRKVAAVAAHPEMSAKDLAALLGVHPSTVHRHRRRLAEGTT